MKRWALALVPVVAGVLCGALYASNPRNGRVEYEALTAVAKLLGALGAGLAARQFDRGDYLRRAWTFIAGCYALLCVNSVVFNVVFDARQYPTAVVLWTVSTAVANVLAVIGMVMTGRAWHLAGLDLPRWVLRASIAITFVFTLAIAAPALRSDFVGVLNGNLLLMASLASEVGDVLALSSIAPVLLTAIALRGGSLAWPWSMHALAWLCWLVLDVQALVLSHFSSEVFVHLTANMVVKVMACTFQMMAGVFQALAVSSLNAEPIGPLDEKSV